MPSDYLSLSLRHDHAGRRAVQARAPTRPNDGDAGGPTVSIDVATLLRAAPDGGGASHHPAGLVVVTGAGGTGASTVARAVAAHLARTRRTLLADLCLDADQAAFHRLSPHLLGVGDLVAACRRGPAPDLRPFTACVPGRGYRLLPGIARRREWTTLRPHAFRVALDALLSCHDAVVADLDADVEGEETTGSIDVEERNVMARTAIAAAAVVLVVAGPEAKGRRSARRVVGDLVEFGVEPARVVTVDGNDPDRAAADVVDRRLGPPRRRAATRVTPGALGW